MNRSIFLLSISLIFILNANIVNARPPSTINLEYDNEGKILNIKIDHVSRDPRSHYIRLIYIYINDEEKYKLFYAKQTDTKGLIDEVPLEANSGDVIRVKAICNEAGYKEGTLVLP